MQIVQLSYICEFQSKRTDQSVAHCLGWNLSFHFILWAQDILRSSSLWNVFSRDCSKGSKTEEFLFFCVPLCSQQLALTEVVLGSSLYMVLKGKNLLKEFNWHHDHLFAIDTFVTFLLLQIPIFQPSWLRNQLDDSSLQCPAAFFIQITGEMPKESAQDSPEGTMIELSCNKDDSIQQDILYL